MKKTIILLLLVLGACTFAHTQCKYDLEERDKITGRRKVAIMSNINKSWKFQISKEEDTYLVTLSLLFEGVSDDFINKGDTLMIYFDKTDPVALLSNADVMPSSGVIGYNIYTLYQPVYKISYEQVKKLSSIRPSYIRVCFNKDLKFYSADIQSKNGKKISQAVKCVMNYKE